jgi:branched-chain amino acid transport system permease protein
MDTSLDPYIGMSLLLKGVIVAILGGLGNFMYGLIGAFILAILETLSIWYVGGEWKDAIAFFVLIVILLFRPTGILKK